MANRNNEGDISLKAWELGNEEASKRDPKNGIYYPGYAKIASGMVIIGALIAWQIAVHSSQ